MRYICQFIRVFNQVSRIQSNISHIFNQASRNQSNIAYLIKCITFSIKYLEFNQVYLVYSIRYHLFMQVRHVFNQVRHRAFWTLYATYFIAFHWIDVYWLELILLKYMAVNYRGNKFFFMPLKQTDINFLFDISFQLCSKYSLPLLLLLNMFYCFQSSLWVKNACSTLHLCFWWNIFLETFIFTTNIFFSNSIHFMNCIFFFSKLHGKW